MGCAGGGDARRARGEIGLLSSRGAASPREIEPREIYDACSFSQTIHMKVGHYDQFSSVYTFPISKNTRVLCENSVGNSVGGKTGALPGRRARLELHGARQRRVGNLRKTVR